MKRVLGLSCLLLVFGLSQASAQVSQRLTRPEVSFATHHDTSPPLRDMPLVEPMFVADHEKPRPIPVPNAEGLAAQTSGPGEPGSVNAGPLVAVTTRAQLRRRRRGRALHAHGAPPDTNGAVGATQYVQWVNTAFAVFNKATGASSTARPRATRSGPASAAAARPTTTATRSSCTTRPPTAGSSRSSPCPTTPFFQCVAVSHDLRRDRHLEPLLVPVRHDFNDYPKIGVWPDAYYVTFNMFNAQARVPRRQGSAPTTAPQMLGRRPPRPQQCFQLLRPSAACCRPISTARRRRRPARRTTW